MYAPSSAQEWPACIKASASASTSCTIRGSANRAQTISALLDCRAQNQGYYYPDQNYPGYSDPGTCIAKPLPLLITTAIPSRTANRLLDHTIQPAGVISATTGFDMLAHDRL